MKVGNILTLAVALLSLGVSVFLFFNRPVADLPVSDSLPDKGSTENAIALAELQENLTSLSNDIAVLKLSLGETAPLDRAGREEEDERVAVVTIDQRLRALEGSISRLQSNYDGISIESSSQEREQIFASNEGAIWADEYFEAGKYAIAAEGYLTYCRNHPDDPDTRDILERARSAYGRAGYQDMAIWTQEEIMRLFPGNEGNDLQALAGLYKEAGDYDEAVRISAEASEQIENPQARLWNRLYWAWYVELKNGSQAGIDAYREVQKEIVAGGYEDHKLNQRAQEKIEELIRALAL